MHKVLSLVILFSVLLVGLSYTQNSYGAMHSFELQWGVSGIQEPGMFLEPQHLAVDSENNIYVTDLGNSRIQKFDDQGNYISSWGSKGSELGQFEQPTGIAVLGDHVFVVDNELNKVQKFDTFGNFILQWGNFGNGNGEFRAPNGITISNDEFVYVVDTGNNRVQKFTSDGDYISHFGQHGKRSGNLLLPKDIAINETGNLFVTDPGNKRINVYSPDGKFKRALDSSIGGFEIYPEGITFDEQNNLYVVDHKNNRILHLNEFGHSYSVFGTMGITESEFKWPKDVTTDSNGFLYVTDTQGHRIQKFSTPVVSEKLIPDEDAIQEQNQKVESFSKSDKIEEEIQLPEVKIIPNDFTKPVIIVPEDIIFEATGGLTSIDIGNAVANDESGIFSLSNNAPESFPLGITTVIWTAIDGSGNMAIASQNITVQDTTLPKIEQLPEIILEARSETQNLVKLGYPSVSDEVGVISIENDAPEVFSLGETIVTWYVTDVMQNISFMQQQVSLVDSTEPRIDIVEDVVIEAESINENMVSLIEPEVFDHVKIESLSNDAPEVFPLGETVVTWTATDTSGNSAISSQKVIIVDTTPPEIFVTDVILESSMTNGNDTVLSLPQINDIQQVDITNNAPEIFPFGETVVTWTVTDDSGNRSTQIQIVNVIDTTSPILILPDDIEIEATGIETMLNDLGEINIEETSEISSITNDAPEVFPLGETVVTWTATDTSGNSSYDTQIVSVVDTTAPQIITSGDINLEASHPIENHVELTDVRVFDSVEIKSITNDAPEVFPLGETVVTWTATDTSGNSSYDTQIVSVVDTTAPVITGPDDLTFEITDKSGMIVNIGNATTTDQVDYNSKITNDSPELFQLGETVVTWTATDTSGNSAIFFQTISIIDSTPPEIVISENIIREAENISSNFVDLENPIVTDIVEVSSITNDAPEVFPLGETVVTWTATDTSENSSIANQLVTIIDTLPPSIIAPESISIEATSKEGSIITLENLIAEDEIGVSSITNDAPEVFPLGETVVTWTATDTSGNSSYDTQIVSVVDTTAPVITGTENIMIDATGLEGNIIELEMITTNDNVGITSITNDAPETFPFGETVVTWIVSDDAGNTSTIQQEISLIDTTVPSIIAPDNIKVEAISNDTNSIDIGSANGFDNIQLKQITNDAPEVFPLGETVVTWTATDTSGNSSYDTQIVSVVDTTAPSILQPKDIVLDATSLTSNNVELVVPIADDVISDIIIDNDAPEVFAFGETIVTWSAKDQSGNISYTDQKVIIIDNTPPNLEVSGDIIVDAISLESIVEIDTPYISDIIDMQPIITNDAPEVFPLGETVVTWTATDTSGNSASITQLVNVKICGNSPSYYNIIMGTAEDDFLIGTTLPDLVFGNGGDDIIIGNNGNDCIFAGEGNDIVFGNEGDDNITTGQGNDIIKGASGDDILKGGTGLDMIDGGDDIDTCIIIDEHNSDLVVKCEVNE